MKNSNMSFTFVKGCSIALSSLFPLSFNLLNVHDFLTLMLWNVSSHLRTSQYTKYNFGAFHEYYMKYARLRVTSKKKVSSLGEDRWQKAGRNKNG